MVKTTESRNAESLNLDNLPTEEILKLMNREDAKVITAVHSQIPKIAQVIEEISPRMERGGRLFYVGAGTSGRLGVLDAVECVPTFSVEPNRVIGILAGGEKAMFVAQEDVEDKADLGAEEIVAYNVSEKDTVIGIAASGNTPFVIGAVKEARKRGALTVALVSNQGSKLEEAAELAIIPVVGPEVLTGSTRMKAGTAQKIVLNMISTTVMVKLNKVYSNLMVDLQANNQKLRERAKVIFQEITGADYAVAEKYLVKAKYNVKLAIIMYKKGCLLAEAEKLLQEKGGNLRLVIG